MAITYPEAHLSPAKGRRDLEKSRAFPLAEAPDGLASFVDYDDRIDQLRHVIEWADVEKSVRWFPRGPRTYCNVYASDVCNVLGGYLPRVWWDRDAIRRIQRGEAIEAVYPGGTREGTIRELGANSLHDWLSEYGPGFGWNVRVAVDSDARRDLGAWVRRECNADGVFGLISARRRNRSRSGHITIALPDPAGPDVPGGNTEISPPVQSQAGSRNRNFFRSDWYLDRKFDSVAFAVRTTGT